MQSDVDSVPLEKMVIISSQDEYSGNLYIRDSNRFTFLMNIRGI
jgi:hypothetical protein